MCIHVTCAGVRQLFDNDYGVTWDLNKRGFHSFTLGFTAPNILFSMFYRFPNLVGVTDTSIWQAASSHGYSYVRLLQCICSIC